MNDPHHRVELVWPAEREDEGMWTVGVHAGVALATVLIATAAMLVHLNRLSRAYFAQDFAQSRRLTSQAMRLVGVWQITLGVALAIIGPRAMPSITLIMCGIAILLLDLVWRKFDGAF